MLVQAILKSKATGGVETVSPTITVADASKILAEKRAEFEADGGAENGYPAGATLCSKCNTKAVSVMDNCATCLSCADSKCG